MDEPVPSHSEMAGTGAILGGTDAPPDSALGTSAPTPRWLRRILVVVLVIAGLQALALALGKHFSTDEFGYAHMAWLLAKGAVTYRDFFDAHPPLLMFFLSPVFRLGGDHPYLIVGLRGLMLIPLAAALWAAARLSRPAGPLASLLAPLFMLVAPGTIRWLTEIRPDALAFALFLCAVALLETPSGRPRLSSWLIGVLAAAACWTTIKAVSYTLALPAVALVFTVLRRRPPRNPLSLPWLLLGCLSCSLVFLGYLAMTGTLVMAWQCCVAWSVKHHTGAPSFPWRRYFDPVMREHVWFLVLAVLGLIHTFFRAHRERALSPGRLLLILAIPLTLLSHAIQRTAYPYNLIPWIGVLVIWAATGMGWLLGRATAWSWRLATLIACAGLLFHAEWRLIGQLGDDNTQQREVLSRLERLTAPTDCVYDNAGSAVSRPHAYYHFYTDVFMRRALAQQLIDEVPPALVAKTCVMRVLDLRSDDLPKPLLDFLRTHYQPMDGDLALWGQRYRVDTAGGADVEFLALTGDYFTFPKVPLTVDGKPVLTDTFHLAAGVHRLRYEGAAGEFFVLWIPRDGHTWQPRFGLPPRFSKLF